MQGHSGSKSPQRVSTPHFLIFSLTSAGLAVYNAFLKAARLRPLLLWGGLLGCAVGLTPLLLVEGVNRKLGISDQLFALVDSALLASIGQVLMMPTLVLCARWVGGVHCT